MIAQAVDAFQHSGDRDGDIGVVRLLRQHPRSQHYVWSRWKTQWLGNRRHKKPIFFWSGKLQIWYFGQEIDYIGILDFFRLNTRQIIGLIKEELDRHFHIVAYIYTQVIIDISGWSHIPIRSRRQSSNVQAQAEHGFKVKLNANTNSMSKHSSRKIFK